MPFSNIIQQKMVVIRLSRAGAKKRPFYHICVSDRRNKRDGKFIERIGFYNPIAKDTEEKIRFDHERYDHWLSVGAKPSDTVLMLLKRSKMSEEEINKIEEKKAAQQQRKKQEAILKKQEEAAKEAEETVQGWFRRHARRERRRQRRVYAGHRRIRLAHGVRSRSIRRLLPSVLRQQG